jgi:hypothetical protein
MPDRTRSVAVVLLLASLAVACTGGGSPSVESRAKEVVREIFSGQFAKVRADFDATMTARLSQQRLAKARTQFEGLFGTFASMGNPEIVKRGDLTVVNIPLHMAKGDGQARVTYDPQERIAGLFLLRSGVPVP